MNPDDKLKISTEDELARASKLSRLYPQPSGDSRSFTHTAPPASTKDKILNSAPVNWVNIAITGLIISLPLITFEIGLAVLSSTTSLTEAGQIGMLATVYVLFIIGLTWLTYKYFSKKIHTTFMSSRLTYWMVVLFSIPAILSTKSIFIAGQSYSMQPFSTGMIMYYFFSATIFIAATTIISYFIQRQGKSESSNVKTIFMFVALPYIFGLLIALSKIL